MESENFVVCVCDRDYEIETKAPHRIRRINKDRFIAESIDSSNGYIQCKLNGKKYLKHRIIAKQFIPNPENKTQVDHINRVKTDNRIENLRWVSSSENNSNKKSYNGVNVEYFDEINEDSMEVREYNNYQFEDYYYDDETDAFYFWNGLQFRKLNVCFDKRGSAFVNMRDINNDRVQIYYARFKRIYGFD